MRKNIFIRIVLRFFFFHPIALHRALSLSPRGIGAVVQKNEQKMESMRSGRKKDKST